MPRADLIAGRDLYNLHSCTLKKGDDNMNNECTCKPEGEIGYPWSYVQPSCPIPVPPPMPFYPPYPAPFPVPPCPPPFPPIPDDPKEGSVSQQICKLSRKANIITKMLENLETKKKDVIITIGGVSYNFGNIDLDLGEGWTDGSYAATVKKILEYELGLIKTKIAELAEELGEEADNLIGGIEGTVGP